MGLWLVEQIDVCGLRNKKSIRSTLRWANKRCGDENKATQFGICKINEL
jgi:hypothetical protein